MGAHFVWCQEAALLGDAAVLSEIGFIMEPTEADRVFAEVQQELAQQMVEVLACLVTAEIYEGQLDRKSVV